MTITPAEALCVAFVTYVETVRRLGKIPGGLGPHALHMIRRDLSRAGHWKPDNIPPGYEQQAQLLRHDVAVALGRLTGMPDYFLDSDSMMPVPDDLSELDQPGGGVA